jgi:hypothetical protein
MIRKIHKQKTTMLYEDAGEHALSFHLLAAIVNYHRIFGFFCTRSTRGSEALPRDWLF